MSKFASIRRSLLILVLIGLAACSPPQAAPPPTPQVLRIQLTPALRNWSARLQQCASNESGIGVLVDELPAGAHDPDGAAFSLRLGPPDEVAGFAAVAGNEQLVPVVNPNNPVEQISSQQLRAIYSGEIKDWQSLVPGGKAMPVEAWTYLPGDDLRAVFEKTLLGSANIPRGMREAPNPGAMLQAVAADAGAIGYVPRSWLGTSLRELSLSDPPADGLSVPVIALSTSEPQGAARTLLACLSKLPD
jgi:hypothetical protein